MLELFYLFFFFSAVLAVLAVASRIGSSTQRISSALSCVLFFGLALQSYSIKKIYVLEVNQSVVEHVVTISDEGFAYVMFGLGIVMLVVAFMSNILVAKEVVS